jgi:hypothetical protein
VATYLSRCFHRGVLRSVNCGILLMGVRVTYFSDLLVGMWSY